MDGFKTLKGNIITNIIEYISDYISKNESIDILIGADSQSYGASQTTLYGVVIVLYKPGNGAHVLAKTKKLPKQYDLQTKLINEVWESIEVAQYLENNGLPKPLWIDIDLNPDPRYRSNTVLRQAVGLVEGMGYRVRYKHSGALCSYAANYLVKS